MNADTKHTSTHHRTEPMCEGFVWQGESVASCIARQLYSGSICIDARHLCDVAIDQTCFAHAPSSRAPTQIPIDYRVV